MKKLIYTDSYKEYFTKAGYKSIKDYFTKDLNPDAIKACNRSVEKIDLPLPTGNTRFFIKRFYRPKIKESLQSLFTFGKFCSRAEIEYRNTKILIKKGFHAHEPVAFGEEKHSGFERRSFFVTKAAPGKDLAALAVEDMPNLEQQQKQALITQLGKELRKINDAGISLPDLYAWHIFVDGPASNGLYKFTFIDLPRMRHKISNFKQLTNELGKLLFSMDRQYFPEPLCRLLINSYAGNDIDADSLWAEASKKNKKIRKRKKRKLYHMYHSV